MRGGGRWRSAWVGWALWPLGCNAVLGLEATSLEPEAGAGGASTTSQHASSASAAATTTGSTAVATTSASSASGGSGGAGGGGGTAQGGAGGGDAGGDPCGPAGLVVNAGFECGRPPWYGDSGTRTELDDAAYGEGALRISLDAAGYGLAQDVDAVEAGPDTCFRVGLSARSTGGAGFVWPALLDERGVSIGGDTRPLGPAWFDFPARTCRLPEGHYPGPFVVLFADVPEGGLSVDVDAFLVEVLPCEGGETPCAEL